VVVGQKALVTRPGAPSRRGEVTLMKKQIEALGLEMIEMEEPCTLDGGDVLVTSKDIFVGLSRRSNAAGAQAVAAAFSLPVTALVVSEGLHLKSLVTCVDNTLFVASSPAGVDILNKIQEAESTRAEKYEFVMIPEDESSGANCTKVGSTIIYR